MPSQVCGGVYRSSRKRRRKTAAKPQLSYAERQQKRIMRKFGAGGKSLGSEESKMEQLEKGKKAKGKPRVAGSARGRELRAAAALARFEKVKESDQKPDWLTEEDSETESDGSATEDESGASFEGPRDSKGRRLLKVGAEEDDDDNDDYVKKEMDELMGLSTRCSGLELLPANGPSLRNDRGLKSEIKLEEKTIGGTKPLDDDPKSSTATDYPAITSDTPLLQSRPAVLKLRSSENKSICAACSLENDHSAILCSACSNVLDPATMQDHWRCQSEACADGAYVNAGDYGRCQICSLPKPK
jgi:hypothetical protein